MARARGDARARAIARRAMTDDERADDVLDVVDVTVVDAVEAVGDAREETRADFLRVDDDAASGGRPHARGARSTDRARDLGRGAIVVALAGALALGGWRLFRWARGGGGAGRPPRRADARFSRAHRKCNRCGKRGDFVKVKCERCKRCWYCSQTCKKAAWAMEICECC